VLGEKIRNMTTFDDFRSITGRPICTSNMYVDGVKVAEVGESITIAGTTMRKRNLKKNPLDQIVNPLEVAAIENYRVAEVPIEYAATKSAGGSHECGVTLVWTR